jgi:DNA-binding NtrC family response regulator
MSRRRRRVLLLEDDAALRGLLHEALAAEAFEVVALDSFVALCAAAARHDGEIVLADFWGGGQRALSETDRREIAELCSLLPVILLTGRSWAAATSAEELGARALMRKPFDLEDLIRTVERVLG